MQVAPNICINYSMKEMTLIFILLRISYIFVAHQLLIYQICIVPLFCAIQFILL